MTIAAVDLFASSLARVGAPIGVDVDALVHPWPNALLYEFPPRSLIVPTLRRVRERGHLVILIALNWRVEVMAEGDHSAFVRAAPVSPVAQGSSITSTRGDFLPRGQSSSLGLTHER